VQRRHARVQNRKGVRNRADLNRHIAKIRAIRHVRGVIAVPNRDPIALDVNLSGGVAGPCRDISYVPSSLSSVECARRPKCPRLHRTECHAKGRAAPTGSSVTIAVSACRTPTPGVQPHLAGQVQRRHARVQNRKGVRNRADLNRHIAKIRAIRHVRGVIAVPNRDPLPWISISGCAAQFGTTAASQPTMIKENITAIDLPVSYGLLVCSSEPGVFCHAWLSQTCSLDV